MLTTEALVADLPEEDKGAQVPGGQSSMYQELATQNVFHLMVAQSPPWLLGSL
jgi:hypothetical protein